MQKVLIAFFETLVANFSTREIGLLEQSFIGSRVYFRMKNPAFKGIPLLIERFFIGFEALCKQPISQLEFFTKA